MILPETPEARREIDRHLDPVDLCRLGKRRNNRDQFGNLQSFG